MQNKIKELELDLSELKFLLEETKKRPEFVAIARRHILRLVGSLEELQKELEQMQNLTPVDREAVSVVGKDDATPKENVPEESVIVQEEEILVEAVEPKIKIEPKAKPEKKEEPGSATVSPVAVFGEQLKPSAELAKSISLNDTFRFSRELFDGDTEKMNQTLQEITRMNTLADVISHISSRTLWDEENEATKDFIELLRKYFV